MNSAQWLTWLRFALSTIGGACIGAASLLCNAGKK